MCGTDVNPSTWVMSYEHRLTRETTDIGRTVLSCHAGALYAVTIGTAIGTSLQQN